VKTLFFLLSFWCLIPKGEKKFSSVYLVSLAYVLLLDCNMRLSGWFV
jgi:hypothetical protein